MRRTIASTVALVLVGLALSACVVEGPPRGPGCRWVPGHYGPYGGWVPGHCAV
jgi:hypothetical protein